MPEATECLVIASQPLDCLRVSLADAACVLIPAFSDGPAAVGLSSRGLPLSGDIAWAALCVG
ncbi:hypothetical protein ABW99_06860 [Pandoraea thiooxydans]|uniref:Uncharacterized protein n=1 Tax=Pandoraea thiooxydans TaxID=445709 RepID=A0A0G3ELQ6_9BURK|nr:hypothetical protein ABW99_06860 [Pandoraea thiooxydans]